MFNYLVITIDNPIKLDNLCPDKTNQNQHNGETNHESAMTKNNSCDNDKCTHSKGEVRVLPTGGDGNVILCRTCFHYEFQYRVERNKTLGKDAQFQLPMWSELKIYESEVAA